MEFDTIQNANEARNKKIDMKSVRMLLSSHVQLISSMEFGHIFEAVHIVRL